MSLKPNPTTSLEWAIDSFRTHWLRRGWAYHHRAVARALLRDLRKLTGRPGKRRVTRG